jgi:hypothetical protein
MRVRYNMFFVCFILAPITITDNVHLPCPEVIESPMTRQPGRPSIVDQHPVVIDVIQEFVEGSGFSAQNRRRSDIGRSCGLGLSQIASHVRRETGVKLGRSTVHRVFSAPNKKTRNSKRFQGKVKARVARKKNDDPGVDHADLHFTCAQVKYNNELFEMFPEETTRLSCDDKNKILTGVPAVSRYHQIRRIFPEEDTINYPQHDFPDSQSKITPSGYLIMQKSPSVPTVRRCRSLSPKRNASTRTSIRSRSVSPVAVREEETEFEEYEDEHGRIRVKYTRRKAYEESRDEQGRTHVKYSRTGTLHMFNRAQRFHRSVAINHANDIHQMLTQGEKGAVLLVSDNGSDWAPKSDVNFVNMGRLWRDLQLNILVQTTYAAGHSSFNMIEHAWSAVSSHLVGVILPNTLPPDATTNMTREEKDAARYDNAIAICNSYFEGKKWSGHPIVAHHVPCIEVTAPFYNDLAVQERVTKATKTELQSPQMEDFRKEYTFFSRHAVRRHNQMEFVVCESAECEHCPFIPITAPKLLRVIRKNGGIVPTPTMSNDHPGHYLTLLEYLDNLKKTGSVTGIDEGLPSQRVVSMCEHGCRTVTFSKQGKKRHDWLVHDGQ